MIRAVVVSSQWPSGGRSGVALVAAAHARWLAEAGMAVSIVGSDDAVLSEDLPVVSRHAVPARGSGALYAPAVVDRRGLAATLAPLNPDLVIVEAWQTALTDATVEVAHAAGWPVLMVSHGISLSPARADLGQWARALLWSYYRFVRFPRLLGGIDRLTALDLEATSARFYDRDRARARGIPVSLVTNTAVHHAPGYVPRDQRLRQILLVGYFSPIKNQRAALRLVPDLPDDVTLLLVGRRSGRYYEQCVRTVERRGWSGRVTFRADDECDLSTEIARSAVVLSTSITEVMPITLLEAMAAGTPFVATPVGAVPSLEGGALAHDRPSFRRALCTFLDDPDAWQVASEAGRAQVLRQFQPERVRGQFLAAVEATLASRRGAAAVPAPTHRSDADRSGGML